jgi:hypothetical protein
VAGSCEHSNESGLHKRQGISGLAEKLSPFQEELCCMELDILYELLT